MISFDLSIANTILTLDARKVIFWKNTAALFIADLHLGKISHFRKSGMAIPAAAATMNLDVLESLFIDYEPKNCYFLGDLFHSATNEEWFDFRRLCLKYNHIHFTLVTGNHDAKLVKYLKTSENDWLNRCDTFELYPFLLAHEPLNYLPDNSLVGEQKNLFRLCGHYHPKVKLVGLGKQQISMPCFHFSENQGILPSFGQFTGGCFIKVREGDRVIGVMNDKIYPIGPSG